MSALTWIAPLFGAVFVGLGAFGAHGLEDVLTTDAKAWWDTATFYGLVHVVLVTAVSRGESQPSNLFAGSCFALLIGAIIFAGTLYAMALGVPRWFGAITPIGGTLLILGWLGLALSALRKAKT